MMDWKFPVLEAQNNLSHLIHTNHLITSNIHWLPEVGLCQSKIQFTMLIELKTLHIEQDESLTARLVNSTSWW